MERVLSNFRIEKIDKSKKSWVDNWHKVIIKDGGEKVVYCVMDKINPGIEVGKRKKEMLSNRKMLKEFVKIGVFRGIFKKGKSHVFANFSFLPPFALLSL